MKLLRWILLVPAFILYVVLAQTICEIVVNWLYSIIFPIEGFWDYLSVGILIPFLITAIVYFFAGSVWVMKLAPNRKLGARILLTVTILLYTVHYFKSYASIPGLRIFLDVGIILVLAFSSFTSEEEQQ